MPAGGWESAPGCIQHGVAAKPYPNVYAAYEKCTSVGGDFFTFGHGSKLGTFADGVNSSYWVLTALGFSVMVAFLIGWVMLEDRKLKAQSAHLRSAGISSAVHTSESR